MRNVSTNVRLIFHQPREHKVFQAGEGEHLHFEVSQDLARTREPIALNPDVDEAVEGIVSELQALGQLPVEGTIEVLLTPSERRLIAVLKFYRGGVRAEIDVLLDSIASHLGALEGNGVELLDLRLDQTIVSLELVDGALV